MLEKVTNNIFSVLSKYTDMSFGSFPFGTGLNLEILSMGEDVLSMHTLMIYTFSIAHS